MATFYTVNTSVSLRAYAKLNLYLAVHERRTDGYHNIETVFQTVGLSDEIRLTPTAEGITVVCDRQDLNTADNLAVRAARLVHERHAPDRGVHIDLNKRIPVAAGLAGGSSDAAATLAGLNELWSLDLDAPTLHAYARELGSDVPCLLRGGTAAGVGRGDELTPLDPMRPTWFVLAHPDFEVSAARVYNHPLLEKRNEERVGAMTPSFKMVCGMLAQGALADALYNSMEAPVFSEYPELAVMKQRLLDAGCAGALMSGSGPTLFGLCRDEAHARAVAASIDGPTSVVPAVSRGYEFVPA